MNTCLSVEQLPDRIVPARQSIVSGGGTNHHPVGGWNPPPNQLPPPQLPSATISVSVDAAGVLTIKGTRFHDNIQVIEEEDGTIVVEGASARRVRDLQDKELEELGSFASGVVTSFFVRLGKGNDSLNLDTFNTALTLTAFGEQGNDYIEGGDGSSTIWGGYGNDQLIGNEGDSLIGGPGRDHVLLIPLDPLVPPLLTRG